ncbi:hypothetical protein GDO81_011841 [Engystomops pustulosus]|uniref:Uncharacterized protein n=1 Tax=Engystomops pustulosus TaxID=76066 RepID=A0AAV7BHN1_ENGPU|nr:hypothetical protein GDO81_011841 [Engystomops pustulosus]
MESTQTPPNLFAFTEDDVNRILGGTLGDSTFLEVPAKVDLKRKYEYWSRRHINFQLHLSLLCQYYKHKIIPRGLRSHLRPNLLPANMEFCTRFEALSNKYALDIILLNIEFLQVELTTGQQKIDALEVELRNLLGETEFNLYKEKTKKILQTFQKEQEETKRHKWARDKDDYATGKVYSWKQEDTPHTRRNRREPPKKRPEQRNNEKSTSDFLGPPPLTPHPSMDREEDVEDVNTTENLKTRSGKASRTQMQTIKKK